MKVFIGALRNSIFGKEKRGKSEGIIVPRMLYRCEAWAINKEVWKRVKVMDIKSMITSKLFHITVYKNSSLR